MISDSINAISVMVFLIALAIYPDSVQSIKETVKRVAQSYKTCRGDYDLMFKKGVDMYSLETIDQMTDTATSKPKFTEVIDSVGVLVAQLQLIQSKPVPEVQLHTDVLAGLIGKSTYHLNALAGVILEATQFLPYLEVRKRVKNVARMFQLWFEHIVDTNAYDKVENSCRLKNASSWFSDLKVYLDTNWTPDQDMAQWVVANIKNSRTDTTRFVALIKADMCKAALLLSVCASVTKLSIELKSRQFHVVNETLEVFRNRFKDADKSLIASARSGLIEDSSQALQSLSTDWPWTQDTLANQIYNVLAPKYYWLNLNVALYEDDERVTFLYQPKTEVECLVYTPAVYAPATNLKWGALVYAWKKSVDPATLAYLATQSRSAKAALDQHVKEVNKKRTSFGFNWCAWNKCYCFDSTNIYENIWQFLPGGAGVHPSYVLIAHAPFGTNVPGINYGNTVGVSVGNGTYMLWSKKDTCGSLDSDIVFFLGSYCPGNPFTYP